MNDARPEDPVRGVSAADAHAYCMWVSAQTGDRVRLPTEAEWVLAMANPRPGSTSVTESDHGVAGLTVPALELVEGPDGMLLKGKTPDEVGAHALRPIGSDERIDGVGFRCVRTPAP